MLPAIAAVIGRGAAVVGRAVVGAGKGLSKAGSTAVKAGGKVAKRTGKSVQNKAARQMKSQLQRSQQKARQNDGLKLGDGNQEQLSIAGMPTGSVAQMAGGLASSLQKPNKSIQALGGSEAIFNQLMESKSPAAKNQLAQKALSANRGLQSLTRNRHGARMSNSIAAGHQKPTKMQEFVKRNAKAVTMRGFIYALNGLANVLDVSTGGLSILIDIFPYAFTLGWLNMEMIYGKWIMDGKDPFIAPISWAPIPMPIDKEARILQGLVIATDLVLIFMFLTIVVWNFFLLWTVASIATHPLEALQHAGGFIWQFFQKFLTS